MNGGVSSARNLGLEEARGEWINFINSDEWVDINHLEKLYADIDGDFIFGGIKLCSSSKSICFEERLLKNKELVTFINSNKGYRLNSPCGHLYQTIIIFDQKIKFDERVSFGEDAIFNLNYLCYCDSVRTISNCGYNYWDYDISSNASLKYNLSIDEIYYALSILVDLNSKLIDKLGGEISSDADYAMMLGMVPVDKRCDNYVGEEFYRICKKLGIVYDREGFYNNELCSPIFLGIAQLKSWYEAKEYSMVKDYYNILYLKSKDVNKIRFRCKDFYLWCFFIKAESFFFLIFA